jgi:hypothetical protein
LAVSVARVIWRDSLAKIADTKIIGIDTQWDIWYNLSSVVESSLDQAWIDRDIAKTKLACEQSTETNFRYIDCSQAKTKSVW